MAAAIAANYQNLGSFAEFNVTWEEFWADPECITDAQFNASPSGGTEAEADAVIADGENVDYYLGEGGAYEPSFSEGDCMAAFEAMAARCSRLTGKWAKTKCYIGAMDCLARCLAAF
jgi:hypothetical protein